MLTYVLCSRTNTNLLFFQFYAISWKENQLSLYILVVPMLYIFFIFHYQNLSKFTNENFFLQNVRVCFVRVKDRDNNVVRKLKKIQSKTFFYWKSELIRFFSYFMSVDTWVKNKCKKRGIVPFNQRGNVKRLYFYFFNYSKNMSLVLLK